MDRGSADSYAPVFAPHARNPPNPPGAGRKSDAYGRFLDHLPGAAHGKLDQLPRAAHNKLDRVSDAVHDKLDHLVDAAHDTCHQYVAKS
jgi:hypothetical protein